MFKNKNKSRTNMGQMHFSLIMILYFKTFSKSISIMNEGFIGMLWPALMLKIPKNAP